MSENTLFFIKPGNFKNVVEIIECLEKSLGSNFRRGNLMHIYHPRRRVVEEHYKEFRGERFFEPMVRAFTNGDIILTSYYGKDIVRRIRKIVGATDPQRAESGTIRSIFSKESLEECLRENRYCNNVVHSSATIKEAKKEFAIWDEYLNSFFKNS